MKKVKLVKQKYQAAILIASLLILSAMLIIALGVAAVLVKDQSISLDSSKSSQAFQIANGGLEIALKEIGRGNKKTLKEINKDSIGDNCKGGIITGSLFNGQYSLTFEDKNGKAITKCDDNSTSIARIKSVGEYKNVNRSIKMIIPWT